MLFLSFLGKVTENQDPDSMNRIRVTRPGEEEYVSEWIPYLTPFAGSDVGFTALPDVDEPVVVMGLDDMGARKVALGGLWVNDFTPPETGENSDADLNQDGKNSLRFIKSRRGGMMIFDDTDGSEKIQMISSEGKSRFELLNEEELVNLKTENDLALGAKGSVSIKTEEDITVTTKKQYNCDVEESQMKSAKTLKAEADSDMAFKGSGIAVN